MSKNNSNISMHFLIGKRIKVYLSSKIKIEGTLCGFDQFLNLVLKEPVILKKKKTEDVGISIIRGSSISYIEESSKESLSF